MTNHLKAVLVGCGGISAAWLNACKNIPSVEIAGLVDLYESAAIKRKAEFGLDKAVTGSDLSDVLEAIHPEVVFDCTVPEAHLPTTLTALRAGCHVLSEKPMSDTMENARTLVETAQREKKIYAVIQNRRYQAEIRQLRSFLDTGALGPLTTLNCDFYLGAHFGGFRDAMQHVLLLDMAIHTFDAARLISGADPVAVTCHEWNPAGSWYTHGASAVAIFEMTGGVVYTYRGSWCSEGLNTTWECDWRVIGHRGSLKWDGQQQLAAQVVKSTGGFHSELEDIEISKTVDVAKIGGHEGLIREFVDCVRSGRTPETTGTDNIHSLSMVHAAILSADLGRRVEISEI